MSGQNEFKPDLSGCSLAELQLLAAKEREAVAQGQDLDLARVVDLPKDLLRQRYKINQLDF